MQETVVSVVGSHSGLSVAAAAAVEASLQEPEGTKRATSVNVQLPCLQKDLRTGSISRDILNFPSELCSCRSGVFTEVARSVPPGGARLLIQGMSEKQM